MLRLTGEQHDLQGMGLKKSQPDSLTLLYETVVLREKLKVIESVESAYY